MSINELQEKLTTFIFLLCLYLSFSIFYLYLPPTTIGESSIDSELTSVNSCPHAYIPKCHQHNATLSKYTL